MLSIKDFPAGKFKLYKLSPKWIGSFKVLEYNPRDQNVLFDFSDFPELSNISNKFHTSLLKPLTPNVHIHSSERKLNRPSPVEDDGWGVEKVLEFSSKPKTGKPQYKVQWKGLPAKYNE